MSNELRYSKAIESMSGRWAVRFPPDSSGLDPNGRELPVALSTMTSWAPPPIPRLHHQRPRLLRAKERHPESQGLRRIISCLLPPIQTGNRGGRLSGENLPSAAHQDSDICFPQKVQSWGQGLPLPLSLPLLDPASICVCQSVVKPGTTEESSRPSRLPRFNTSGISTIHLLSSLTHRLRESACQPDKESPTIDRVAFSSVDIDPKPSPLLCASP
ncbi:hypothetical protein CKAH01_04822 [Colletotrichum kahawae]|uniref:Uncharacterized protein n=1 Tax=Colletotrichum kahawae TaxID=34407 RepID=A0AAD9YIQ7_COLKA|nr:hypothetical protein CKAH01_04822 [Colletotrichum kahawae]